MVCYVPGCGGDAKSKGLCWVHFGRLRRNGDPLASGRHGGSRTAGAGAQNVPDPRPLQAFRLELEASREAGVAFAPAWRSATEAAPDEWREALAATRTAWRTAYLRTGRTFPLGALLAGLEPKAVDRRRSGPPVVVYGVRHDGPTQLEALIVPWCN